MPVIHVIKDFKSSSGGPSVIVKFLVEYSEGEDYVICLNPFRLYHFSGGGMKCLPIKKLLRFCKFSEHKKNSQSEKSLIFHFHGVWDPFIAVIAFTVQVFRFATVFQPHGMLMDLAMREKLWQKKIYWCLVWGSIIKNSDLVIFMSDYEKVSSSVLKGFQKIRVIDYKGVSYSNFFVRNPPKPRIESKAYFLYLGRFEKLRHLKDLFLLIDSGEWSDYIFMFVGPGEIKGNDNNNPLFDKTDNNILFLPEVTGDRKIALIRGAAAVIVPSEYESFGLAVDEALCCRVPVIVTKNSPWGSLSDNQCFCIDTTSGYLCIDLGRAIKGLERKWKSKPEEDVRYGRLPNDIFRDYKILLDKVS